jgi:hypothetical protein
VVKLGLLDEFLGRPHDVLKKLTAYLLGLVSIVAASSVLAGPATLFQVQVASSNGTAGVSLNVQVMAVDNSNFIDSGFTGTVTFGSSDTIAILPADYTFTAGDSGVKIFPVTFRKAGSQTITVSTLPPSIFIMGTSTSVNVGGGAATSLAINAPASANVGTPITATITLKDAWGNAANAYSGTIHVSATDPSSVVHNATDSAVTLPTDAILTGSTGTRSVTLNAIGNWKITTADTLNGALTATTPTISVTATPVVTTSVPSLTFTPNQSMLTSSFTQSVTVSNTGGGAATSVALSVPAGYTLSHTCGATLNPGATCTANVAFAPPTATTITGNLSIASNAGTATVGLTGTGDQSLSTHFYQSILRRNPDAPGKSFWDGEAARLAGLGANVNETWYAMAISFFFSAEYAGFNRNDTDYVTDLYNTFFNRAPDAPGLANWTGQLAQGMPREVVLASFLFSPEFTAFTQSVFGTVTVRPEIDMTGDFYRGLLARLPDSSGFTTWLGQFRTSQCSGASAINATVESISSQFVASAEYTARNRTTAQYVGDLYNAFLRRGGDLAGVQFWINQINTNAQTKDQVRKAFIAAPEFAARVNAVIAAGVAPGVTCPGGVDLDINGTPIPNPTGAPGAVMCDRDPVTGAAIPYPGSGPGPCGSYRIPVGNCTTGLTGANAINSAYEYILENIQPGSLRLGNSIRLTVPRDAAMVFRFKTGPASAFPEFSLAPFYRNLTIGFDEQVSRGPAAPHFTTISESPCDFDYTKTLAGGSLNGCYVTQSSSGSMLAKIWPAASVPATPAADFPYCPLKPDTVYYLNIRYEDASTVSGKGVLSCPAAGCGAAIGFN